MSKQSPLSFLQVCCDGKNFKVFLSLSTKVTRKDLFPLVQQRYSDLFNEKIEIVSIVDEVGDIVFDDSGKMCISDLKNMYGGAQRFEVKVKDQPPNENPHKKDQLQPVVVSGTNPKKSSPASTYKPGSAQMRQQPRSVGLELQHHRPPPPRLSMQSKSPHVVSLVSPQISPKHGPPSASSVARSSTDSNGVTPAQAQKIAMSARSQRLGPYGPKRPHQITARPPPPRVLPNSRNRADLKSFHRNSPLPRAFQAQMRSSRPLPTQVPYATTHLQAIVVSGHSEGKPPASSGVTQSISSISNSRSAIDITNDGDQTKSFPCKNPGCNKVFSRASDLSKHVNQHHVSCGFKCVCGKTFVTPIWFRRHTEECSVRRKQRYGSTPQHLQPKPTTRQYRPPPPPQPTPTTRTTSTAPPQPTSSAYTQQKQSHGRYAQHYNPPHQPHTTRRHQAHVARYTRPQTLHRPPTGPQSSVPSHMNITQLWLAIEWNSRENSGYDPRNVPTNRSVWWQCRKNHLHPPWHAAVATRLYGRGSCPQCTKMQTKTSPRKKAKKNGKEGTTKYVPCHFCQKIREVGRVVQCSAASCSNAFCIDCRIKLPAHLKVKTTEQFHAWSEQIKDGKSLFSCIHCRGISSKCPGIGCQNPKKRRGRPPTKDRAIAKSKNKVPRTSNTTPTGSATPTGNTTPTGNSSNNSSSRQNAQNDRIFALSSAMAGTSVPPPLERVKLPDPTSGDGRTKVKSEKMDIERSSTAKEDDSKSPFPTLKRALQQYFQDEKQQYSSTTGKRKAESPASDHRKSKRPKHTAVVVPGRVVKTDKIGLSGSTDMLSSKIDSRLKSPLGYQANFESEESKATQAFVLENFADLFDATQSLTHGRNYTLLNEIDRAVLGKLGDRRWDAHNKGIVLAYNILKNENEVQHRAQRHFMRMMSSTLMDEFSFKITTRIVNELKTIGLKKNTKQWLRIVKNGEKDVDLYFNLPEKCNDRVEMFCVAAVKALNQERLSKGRVIYSIKSFNSDKARQLKNDDFLSNLTRSFFFDQTFKPTPGVEVRDIEMDETESAESDIELDDDPDYNPNNPNE